MPAQSIFHQNKVPIYGQLQENSKNDFNLSTYQQSNDVNQSFTGRNNQLLESSVLQQASQCSRSKSNTVGGQRSTMKKQDKDRMRQIDHENNILLKKMIDILKVSTVCADLKMEVAQSL